MSILEQAIEFAVQRHSGQIRKLSNTAYILHPLEVLTIVGTMTKDEEVMAGAVLHDVVEDTKTDLQEIEKRFGKRVSYLVSTETENKRREIPAELTWKVRKEESLEVLKQSDDIGVKIIWLGDKLANMRSFYREQQKGINIFEKLNEKDPKEHKWYYFQIADLLKELKKFPAYEEYVNITEKLFEGV